MCVCVSMRTKEMPGKTSFAFGCVFFFLLFNEAGGRKMKGVCKECFLIYFLEVN